MNVAMARRVRVLVAAAVLGSAAGCVDGPTAVHLTDLVGSWNLVHLNRTSATSGETTDALQTDGITSMTMTVATDGKVTTVTVSGTASPVTGGGTIAVSGNKGKLLLDGQAFYGNFTLKSGQLTIDCGTQLGLEEFSRITFVFGKQ